MSREDWKEATLGEVATFTIGRTPARKIPDYWTQDLTYPFLTIKGMGSGEFEEGVTELAIADNKAKAAPEGALLLSFKLSVGRVITAHRTVYYNEAIAWIKPDEDVVSQEFLALALENVDWTYQGNLAIKGKTLNSQSLKLVGIPLPPADQQHEIVNFMQALDLMIQAGDREISGAKEVRGDVLNSILFGNDSEWEEVLFSDIATINPRIKPLAPDTPFIEMADVDTWGRWAIPSGEKGKRGGIRACGGDTLMARITPCLENGKIAQVPSDFGYVGGSTEFIVLRATEESLPDFIFLLTQSHKVHAESIGLMVGTSGRQRVSAKDVGNISVTFPPLEEQEKIVEKMQTLDAYLESAKRSQEALKQVRKDALHALLSGDKDVRDLAEMFATDEDVA